MQSKTNLFQNGLFFLLSLSMMFFSCTSGNRQGKQKKSKPKISISGAFALYPLTVRWSEVFNRENPNIKIDISAGGAGKGMVDAMSGMVDLGMFSRHITEAEQAQGVWYIAVAKDAVVPTINAKNPALEMIQQKGIQRSVFQEIYLEKHNKKWSDLTGNSKDNEVIKVYTRSDACGAAEMWAQFLGKSQENLEGIGIFGDPGIADAVKSDLNGIGFNNIIFAYDLKTGEPFEGLGIIPIDLNENGKIDPEENFYGQITDINRAIANNQYPSPPARELYFVAKSYPQNEYVLQFLKWILTEGQQYVEEAGYVPLDEQSLKIQLQKLNRDAADNNDQ
ncbi:MAG: PstS family phosphate ABC transporter substrate-binding protein [Bacteroidales bacterium]|nr:PstS family phosphate ABC transporter substrate-binding protein [Bacteroidales bacterium]MDY0084942.1 PstS family phosphate ABC transporter substrate-binding protein [Bacteroidales bacterium]